MKIKKPIFWDKKKPNFLTYILFPLTFLIKINNIIIKFFTKKKFNQIKTICVGNIYLGGTGKTPTSLKLYQILKTKKYNTVIGKKYYSNQKDEIILLKNKSNFISSKNREKIIKIAIDKNYELIIFDDGLQERRIHYDLRFVCFDSKIWLGNRYLIPSGPLRENIYSLKKYDGVFLNGNDEETIKIKKTLRAINPNLKIFEAQYFVSNIDRHDQNQNYIAFSGIGNPNSFLKTLKKNQFKIIKSFTFPDHYNYSELDLIKIKKTASNLKAKIITTEKDYNRINNLNYNGIEFLKVNLKIENKIELINFLNNLI